MPPFLTGILLLTIGSKILFNNHFQNNVKDDPADTLPNPKFYCESRQKLYNSQVSADLFAELSFECDETPATTDDLNNFVRQKYQFSPIINTTSSKHVMRQFYTIMRQYLICHGQRELPRQVNCTVINEMIAMARNHTPDSIVIECEEQLDELDLQVDSITLGMSFYLCDVFERPLLEMYLEMANDVKKADEMVVLVTDKIRTDEAMNQDNSEKAEYFRNCLFKDEKWGDD